MPRRLTSTRGRQVGLGVGVGLAVAVVLLVAAQLVLPGIAEHRVKDRLAKSDGPVVSITVKAFPAVKLLFGRADEVDVHLRRVSVGRVGNTDLRHVERLNTLIDAFDTALGTATDVVVDKNGDRLSAALNLDPASAAAADLAVGANGQLTGRFVGFPFSVIAEGGRLVARAIAGPLTILLPARDLLAVKGVSIDGTIAVRVGTKIRLVVTGHLT